MAELGQQTVEFSTLVSRAAEDSFISLKELVEKSKSSDMSDSEKKINLLKFIVKTQQRMLRLNVLAKWCQQVPLIQYCQQLASTLSSHDTCFSQTADSLFFMHEGLQQARAPIYDVPSAIEVLLTGSYERLPKCIEDVGMQSSLNEIQQKPALKKLDILVRSKLVETSLPKEISEVKVSDGTALLRVDGEFQVLVTLGYRGHLNLWRILHMELLVGERNGAIKLEELRRFALGDDLERRMAAADEQQNPFMILYSVLHEFCVALVMDTVIRQVHALRQGRWKDAIKFELISDGSTTQGGSASATQISQDGEYETSGQRTPGVKIVYWLDLDKNSGTSDGGICPFIKIESGPDLQIKCIHSTFVIDPLTGKEAEFYLDQSCIDVEKLLLKAIRCNRYTRLLEINKELTKNGQIFRGTGDVLLQGIMDEIGVDHKKKDAASVARESDGQEVLYVRAYGSSFFILGINIRNGRYQLQSSRNIITPSVLSDSEDSLNQGSLSAAEIFINLRSKSILHLFSSIGKFLGLEVYENGFCSVKVPKDILIGAGFLLMGFPDCGSSYFLLIQLDKDFKIVFELVGTQPEQPGKSNNLVAGRVKRIDVGQMQMLEDELNLSILDLRKVGAGSHNQPSNFGLVSNYSHEGLMPVTLCPPPSSFSSIVDEIFELEKGTSAPHSVSNVSSSISTSAASHLGSVPMNLHSSRVGIGSSTQEENAQMSQINPAIKFSPHYSGSLYSAANVKGLSQSTSVSSLTFAQQRNSATQKLSVSKSEQDLASLRSPQSVEVSSFRSMDEDHLRSVNGKSQDAISSRSWRISSLQSTGVRASASDANGIALKSWAATPIYAGCRTASEHDKDSRKRKVSDMLNSLPSLWGLVDGVSKRRKLLNDQHSVNSDIPLNTICNPEGYTYGDLLAEANKGNAPSGVYVSALLHVVRHCSLCIKHAMLTSQMEALDIPYVEEIGLRNATVNIWFKLPSARGGSWPHICLRLGKPGSLCWDVKINDQHFRDLWELQKGSSNTPWGNGVRIANTSDVDSHIRYDSEGVVLIYHSVEMDSIKKLVADIHRLSNARMFALGMRKLLGVKTEEKLEEGANSDCKSVVGAKGSIDGVDKFSEQMRRAFRIEAVGLLSLWFSFGSGVLARFVVEWESGTEGCTMHVSPDQLWPHTKFLEDFINGGEVASLLDCIRLTAGPLHALAAATRPARAGQAAIIQGVGSTVSASSRLGTYASALGAPPSGLSPSVGGQGIAGSAGNSVASAAAAAAALGNHAGVMLAAAGRGGSGIVPSSLLPIDVSVVLRGPYWIRIIYRKHFAVDMRCFAGDQVWLQPATPPKGGPSVGGSLPCPQFRPFIMEHVAQELNGLEPNFVGGQQTVGLSNSSNLTSGLSPPLTSVNGSRVNLPSTSGLSRPGNQVSAMNRAGNPLTAPSNMPAAGPGLSLRRYPAAGGAAHVRGELNTAIIGLGDDGGYGGGWVPLVALKKVLRGILKYLGVLWLFAQLPDLLKEILGSILKENEGALLNLDQEQPALRFFVGGYVFAVSVHRVQLLLQVLSVKRFSHQQQQQQNSASAQEELTQSEISEICDYFSRRVASEPYDASRVASFITLLTLPISVLREFLKLITWKKVMSQSQGGDVAPAQKPRIELCLENHAGLNMDGISGNLSATKSNIHYDRPNNSVDFALTVVLDPAHIPHINAAGGAAWLPYCVSVRLRYSFGDNTAVSFLGMEGSHGGRACWLRVDEWEKCKQRVARAIEVPGSSPADIAQGRLRLVADNVQRALHLCLQGLRDSGAGVPGTSGAS
ncbi:mediator of RNA polymerase II transcription subunit 14-like [Chenopodium quinoa]|uniref:mediator of RNA polymerase II transcription subunit 14-like n=1 Tax=Chenopodium quinoa TaxID=63459 RepID=UPI000B76BCAE|nr:mediator of RNA polymerase II transcription subunit 14-like [Chenopodium quinoa]